MIAFRLDAMKKTFFDRTAVIAAADRATIRNLSKMGSFIRRKARDLLRKKKAGVYSTPGQPPFSHGDQRLKKGILFGYDAPNRSVVVGPVLEGKRNAGSTVPATLEFGGQVRVTEVLRDGKWIRAGLVEFVERRGLQSRVRTADIAPRPFMSRAEEIERGKHAQLWKDSIT